MKALTIASRSSKLATIQARLVGDAIVRVLPNVTVDYIDCHSSADLHQRPISTEGGKGVFVKEISNLVLTGKADIAVHSCKDMPILQPSGLVISGFLPRGDCRDAMVGKGFLGERFGSSSLRRKAQFQSLTKGSCFIDLRGNMQTRKNKLANGEFDTLIGAAAAMSRLEWDNFTKISSELCLPAAAQGAIAIEISSSNRSLHQLIRRVNCADTAYCVQLEREVLRLLGVGCLCAVAVQATCTSG